MPLDFINSVESGINRLGTGGWLTPASVHGLTEADFVTLPTAQRTELFRLVAEFDTIAHAASNADAAQEGTARGALVRIWELLRPYRTPESRTIREVLWAAWSEERESWIPTFDYRLGEDWSGDPAVWVWLILNDDVDVEALPTRQKLGRLRQLVHVRLEDAGITRWPYISVQSRSEVKEATEAKA